MAEEEETLVDTITAAVAEQKSEEPEPQSPEAEQPEEKKDDGERDASGRFKSKAEAVVQKEDGKPSEDKPEEQKETVRPDITRPPRRLPVRTKGVWQTLSPELREDIWAREQEFDTAFKRYDGLGKYAMKAEAVGTNLPKVMEDYYGLEMAIRQDPIQGAVAIWQRLGFDPQMVLSELFRRAGAGPQEQQPQYQQGPPPLTREEVLSLNRQDRMQYETESQIKTFEADPKHGYLEPLIPGEPPGQFRSYMVRVLSPDPFGNPPLANGLEDAYDMACKQFNLPNARLNGNAATGTRTAAVDRSRAANKATVGAPSQGSNAGQKTPIDGNLDVFDTVRAAVQRQRG